MAIVMPMLEHRTKQTTVIEVDDDERAANSAGHGARLGEDTPVPAAAPTKDDGGGASSSEEKLPAPPPASLRMDLACCYVPDHNEDAYFVHPRAGVIGVADGVGGYRDTPGVDAAAFARALMRHAQAGANDATDPYALLQAAYLKAAGAGTPGASTAAILSLRGATLRWAYVGDSGFAVFRGGRMARRSAPQQRYFNCPYQLCSAAGNGDSVADAAVGEMNVAEGDVVVVGTDGLFDNVFDVELECIVRKGAEMGLLAQIMAEMIAAAARKASRGLGATPFSLARARSGKGGGRERVYGGGKPDDITVVVAYIVPKDSS